MTVNIVPRNVPVLMKFTDGGVDQRNSLESVKCSSICIFKELNLDMMILARCAPGQSWINPAERVMSILNLGLQNCALERSKLDDDTEKILKKCNGMNDLRKRPEIKNKYHESIQPVQNIITERFERLALKDDPIKCVKPVSDLEIDLLQRHLRELFPDLNLTKLQKIYTQKCHDYKEWMKKHARERTYTTQLRKCDDEECCPRPKLPKELLTWLPDPVLLNDEHYHTYQDIKGQVTEETLPSAQLKKKKDLVVQDDVLVPDDATQLIVQDEQAATVDTANEAEIEQEQNTEAEEYENVGHKSIFTAQCARMCIICVECRKPRVLYSQRNLSERQVVDLITSLSEFDYTCGSPILPPKHYLVKKVSCRPNLQCGTHIEIPYYSPTVSVGRKDLCCVCAIEEAVASNDLKKQFKTVLPLCRDCEIKGKSPVKLRPYGKVRAKKN